jgi:hypothetical protein
LIYKKTMIANLISKTLNYMEIIALTSNNYQILVYPKKIQNSLKLTNLILIVIIDTALIQKFID